MTFADALILHLAEWDTLQAKRRAIMADPAHCNATSGPMQKNSEALRECERQMFQLKNAAADADRAAQRIKDNPPAESE
jgi:hypothetical protein